MSEVADRKARLRANIDALESALVPAVDLVDAIAEDCRALEGDYDGLIFWPLARPTADRQGSEFTEWRKRVDHVLGRL